MPRPVKTIGECDSCGSDNLLLDGKETTTCRTCGQHITSVWICGSCGEVMQITTINPRSPFMEDEDIEKGREHYGFKEEDLQKVGS